MTFPDRRKPGLYVACKAFGIKKWAGFAMNCELGLKRCQQLRIAGQTKRRFFIIYQAVDNQFGEAHGRNKTGSYAPAERCTGARENRCACTQGVADSRMRSERRRIEEQVGEPMPRQVLIIARDTARKDKPVGIYASQLRLFPQIAHGTIIGTRKPQHTAVETAQDFHPEVEICGDNSELLLKAQNTKPDSGSPSSAREGVFTAIARFELVPIKSRQVDNLFAENTLLSLGDHDAVGQYVVHIRAPLLPA